MGQENRLVIGTVHMHISLCIHLTTQDKHVLVNKHAVLATPPLISPMEMYNTYTLEMVPSIKVEPRELK